MGIITNYRWTSQLSSRMLKGMTQPTAVMLTCRRWLDFGRSSAALCR